MPSGFQTYDRFQWSRSLSTTMPKLIREVENAAKNNYAILALLEAQGRISTGHGGEGIQWPVKYKRHSAQAATGENARNFTPASLFKTAGLDYRGYEVTDSIKRREMEKNKGEAAIIKLLDGFAQRLQASLIEELGPQFYVDGEENDRMWHGFKTLARTNGQTINIDGSGVRTKNAADKVAAPSGSYANLSCVLGYYGGAQESGVAYPAGQQDPEYDYWSPLIVQRDSSGFDNAAGNAGDGEKLEKAIRFGLTHAQRNSTLDGQITNVFMDRDLFIDLKDFEGGRQTIETKIAPGSVVELGFLNSFKFDGVDLLYENAVPSGYAFGVNMSAMELMALTDELFTDEGGPQYDLATQSLNAVVSTLSNIKYKSPRNFVVWKPNSEI